MFLEVCLYFMQNRVTVSHDVEFSMAYYNVFKPWCSGFSIYFIIIRLGSVTDHCREIFLLVQLVHQKVLAPGMVLVALDSIELNVSSDRTCF